MRWGLSYFEKKEKLREEAMAWKDSLRKIPYTSEQLSEKKAYFEKKGKQLGLTQEFRRLRII